MSSKKLLAVLSRYLWPVDSGRKESLNHYFKELHENYGYEIRIMCFMEPLQIYNPNDFPEWVTDVTVLEDAGFTQKLGNLFVHSFCGSKWPLQCSLYYSKKNFKIIKERVEQWKPDVIFSEMIRTCVYYKAFKNSGAIKLANLDDLLSKRYLRQADFGNSKANIAGTYSRKLPRPILKLMNNKWVRRTILRIEAKHCERWEDNYYELFDYVLMTSDTERDDINRRMNAKKAFTLSVGVDCEYYRQKCKDEPDPKGISFLGNFAVAANVDSLELIVKEILPLLDMDFHFYVIGKCPEEIRDRYAKNKKIIFCGRVDDIREYIKKTTVFLSPISYGTGIKTKIVEAMAMGIPVVTNSVGCEEINAENGKDYFVEDNVELLAKIVKDLLENKNKAQKVGQNASQFAYDHFRWEKVLSVFKEIGL